MASGGLNTPRAFLRRHSRAVIGVAAAGVAAPAVLVAVVAARAGRFHGLRIFRRWRRALVAELEKWR